MALAQNLSARVEEVMKAVLGGESDELDGPSFDVVGFINRTFPDERSLEGLGPAISGYDSQIRELDRTILETVREQSTAGTLAARDIGDATESISVLQAKVNEIKGKAQATEQLVDSISKDIRGLDTAKRHLEVTIQALSRLRSLEACVGRVRRHSALKDYEQAAPDFDGAVQILLQFSDYLHVPKVRDISRAVEGVRDELKKNMTDDFDFLLDTVTPSRVPAGPLDDVLEGRELNEGNLATLESLYPCCDALGSSVRLDLLGTFVRKQLKPYGQLFRHKSASAPLGGTLQGVEGRYAWFKAAQRAVEVRYGKTLPRRWRVEHRMAIEFCQATRTDIEGILNDFEGPSAAPADALVGALIKTLAFEKEMVKRYEGADFYRVAGPTSAAGGSSSSSSSGEPEETYDKSQPLYTAEGRVVDPTSPEGIKLNWAREREFKARLEAAKVRRAERAKQQQEIAALGGYEKGKAGAIVTGEASLAGELAALPRFMASAREGLISGAFKPYLQCYVQLERSKIDEVIAKATQDDLRKPSEGGGGEAAASASASMLPSASLLLATCQHAFMRCEKLNAGDVLFSLYENIRQAMELYTARLSERLPVPIRGARSAQTEAYPGLLLGGDTYGVAEAEALRAVDCCCLVFTTAEVCAEMVVKFAEVVVQQHLEEEYKPRVNAEALQRPFYELSRAASTHLGALTASLCDPAFSRIWGTEWARVTHVGDHSPYVRDICDTLRRAFAIARRRLDVTPFRKYVDTFVRAFIPRYTNAMQRSQRVSETAAQQLLLDAQEIKRCLLSLPACAPASDRVLASIAGSGLWPAAGEEEEGGEKGEGGSGGAGGAGGSGSSSSSSSSAGSGFSAPSAEALALVPKSYTAFINKEMPRLELFVKVLAAPKESFANTIRALWPGASQDNVKRFLDMRDFSAKEQEEVYRELGFAKKGGAGGGGGGGMLGGLGGWAGGISPPATQTPGSATAAAAAVSSAAASTANKMMGMAKLFGGGGKK